MEEMEQDAARMARRFKLVGGGGWSAEEEARRKQAVTKMIEVGIIKKPISDREREDGRSFADLSIVSKCLAFSALA